MKQKLSLIKFFLLAVTAALILSGCKANVITKINSDGSGNFKQEIGFTAEEMTTLSSLGSGSDFCATMGSENSVTGASISQEKRGDETWCIFDTPFSTLDELNTLYSSADTSVNDISINNDNLHYEVTVNMSGTNATAGLLQTKWIVTMPGKVSNHNANEISGSTLTWDLTLGQDMNLIADSSTKGGLNNTWTIVLVVGLLCLCLVVIMIIGVVIFLVVRKNKKKQAPNPETVNPL
jgi:uncharacterized protein YceK